MTRGGRRAAAIGIGALALTALSVVLAPSSGQAAPPEVRLDGFAAFDYHQYFLDMEGAVPATTMLRLAPRLKARWKWVRAVAEVEFRHDFNDPGRGRRVILRELVAGMRVKGFRLEGGALVERWGKMDVASPTDTLTALDYEELFFPDPLPVPGILIGFARDVVSVKGVFIPAFVPARFRNATPSRWDMTRFLPGTQSVPFPQPIGDLEFDLVYDEFVDAEATGEASNLARGFEGGARVDLFLPSVDIGFSFATVHDRLPSYTRFAAKNTTDDDNTGEFDHIEQGRAVLRIEPIHQRLWVPGIDLAVNAGPLVFKGEAAFFLTEDLQHESCLLDDPYVKYAAGLELVLQNLVGSFDLAVRFQYNGDVEIRKDGDDVVNADEDCQEITIADPDRTEPLPTDYQSGSTATGAIRHPYTHAFYWNVNLGFTDQLSLDLRGFVDIAGDVLFTGKLSYAFLDRFEFSGGWMVIRGAEGTLFEPYGDNHRLELGFSYRF